MKSRRRYSSRRARGFPSTSAAMMPRTNASRLANNPLARRCSCGGAATTAATGGGGATGAICGWGGTAFGGGGGVASGAARLCAASANCSINDASCGLICGGGFGAVVCCGRSCCGAIRALRALLTTLEITAKSTNTIQRSPPMSCTAVPYLTGGVGGACWSVDASDEPPIVARMSVSA